MPKGLISLGGGRNITRTRGKQLKKLGFGPLSAGVVGGNKYVNKRSHPGSSLKRRVRLGTVTKRIEKNGERFIVGSANWNSSSYRRRKGY